MKIDWKNTDKLAETIPYEKGKLYRVRSCIENSKKSIGFCVFVQKSYNKYQILKDGDYLLYLNVCRYEKGNPPYLYYKFLFGEEVVFVNHLRAKKYIPCMQKRKK